MTVTVDWSKCHTDTCREIIRQAEAYLQGTVQLAVSSDQRAGVLCGVFTTAAGALLAAIVALATVNRGDPAIFAGAGISAALFLAGSTLCICATLPTDFWLPGNEPENWYENVNLGESLENSLGEIAVFYQERIEHNRAMLATSANRFHKGAIAGAAAPAIGFAAWAATSFCAPLFS